MKLVNLGIVCIFLAQCLVFIPCKGAEASCSCQQITEKLTGMEERLLEAMKNQTSKWMFVNHVKLLILFLNESVSHLTDNYTTVW